LWHVGTGFSCFEGLFGGVSGLLGFFCAIEQSGGVVGKHLFRLVELVPLGGGQLRDTSRIQFGKQVQEGGYVFIIAVTPELPVLPC